MTVIMFDLVLSLISWKPEPVMLIEGFEFWLHKLSEALIADKTGRCW